MKRLFVVLCLMMVTLFANVAYADYFADAGKVIHEKIVCSVMSDDGHVVCQCCVR